MRILKQLTLVILFIVLISGFSELYSQVGTTQPMRPPGNGTEESPYLIRTLAHLRWMSELPSEWWIDGFTHVHFKQTADIDASETSE